MRILLIFSFLLFTGYAAAGQSAGSFTPASTPITRAEFDTVMARAAENVAAREAGPNRESISTRSSFERTGTGIGWDTVTIEKDSAGNSRITTRTFAGQNGRDAGRKWIERVTIIVGRWKYEQTNGGPWAALQFEPRPAPPPTAWVNPYPENAEFRELFSGRTNYPPGNHIFEVVYSKRARSEGASEYIENWKVKLVLHMGHLINMTQTVRASGPMGPTQTTIEYQWSFLPPFKIILPLKTKTPG